MSNFLHAFAQAFSGLNKHNLAQLDSLYSQDALFIDPLHEVRGLANIRRYFAQMYANIDALQFDFYGFDEVSASEGYLRWTMSYRHARLAGGQLIRVQGCSHLLWSDGKVYRHRDYFDAGALLYEHLPILGAIIRWLKRRLV